MGEGGHHSWGSRSGGRGEKLQGYHLGAVAEEAQALENQIRQTRILGGMNCVDKSIKIELKGHVCSRKFNKLDERKLLELDKRLTIYKGDERERDKGTHWDTITEALGCWAERRTLRNLVA